MKVTIEISPKEAASLRRKLTADRLDEGCSIEDYIVSMAILRRVVVEEGINKRHKSGTCLVCGCTDDHACPGGCSWIDADHTLCSSCADA